MRDKFKESKFNEVYESFGDTVFRFSLFRVSNRESALDITQETFMRYWDTLVSDKDIKNDKALLFTICRNLIIDYYRKKKSVSLDELIDDIDDGSFLLEDKNKNLNSYSSAEGRFVLEKLNELESSNRQIIYLRFVEDLKPAEIAEILGVSANVVSVRITRALDKLRDITGFNIENKHE